MSHAFDSKALELSRKTMGLMYGPMPVGGSCQLQAQIQNLFIEAMQFAAPAVQAEQEPVGIIRYVDIGIPDTKGIHATFYTKLPEGTELFARPVQAEQLSGNTEQVTKCWCHTCRPVTMTDMRFVVCPDCGNKRCPHANDHRNTCTGSNEPGQEGSAYPDAPQQEAE